MTPVEWVRSGNKPFSLRIPRKKRWIINYSLRGFFRLKHCLVLEHLTEIFWLAGQQYLDEKWVISPPLFVMVSCFLHLIVLG